jgi:hypothetical protein
MSLRLLLCGALLALARGDEAVEKLAEFGQVYRDRLEITETSFHKMTIPASAPAIKVAIVPLFGDADLFLSFEPFEDINDANWRMENSGLDEMIIRRTAVDWTCPDPDACVLHFASYGYTTTEFLFSIVPVDDPTITDPNEIECAPGCSHFELTDNECHLDCNTTACMYDGGDCLIEEKYCARGCPISWTDDDLCDDACFVPECNWDGDACFDDMSMTAGCAPKCLPRWINDGECDFECNVEACGFDGEDCFHGHTECYYEPRGTDYRGTVSHTKSGKECQHWNEQYPHQHTRTATWYPDAGLGGHNFCRNPDNESAPWCYTLDPGVRWEPCNLVNAPSCPQMAPPSELKEGEISAVDSVCADGFYLRTTGICTPCTECADGMDERIGCSTDYNRVCTPACSVEHSSRFDAEGRGALAMVQKLCAYGSYNYSSVASFDAKKLCSSYCCHAFDLASSACDYAGQHLSTWNDIKKNLAIGHETLCKTLVDSCPSFNDALAKGDKNSQDADGGALGGASGARPSRPRGRGQDQQHVTTAEAVSNPFIFTALTIGAAALVSLCLGFMWYRRRVKQTLLYASPNAPEPEEMQEQPRDP